MGADNTCNAVGRPGPAGVLLVRHRRALFGPGRRANLD